MSEFGKKLDMAKYTALLASCKDDKEFRRRLAAGEADEVTTPPPSKAIAKAEGK